MLNRHHHLSILDFVELFEPHEVHFVLVLILSVQLLKHPSILELVTQAHSQ